MTVYKTLVAVLIAVMASTATANDWDDQLADTPEPQNSGSALVLGSAAEGWLYAIFGGTNKLYRYDISADAWDDDPADLPSGTFSAGAALTSDKSNYIYALTGGGTQAFWRYRISDDSWLQYADIPAAVSGGGALAWASRSGYAWVYAIRGNTSPYFYKFGPVSLPGRMEPRDIRYWQRLDDLGNAFTTFPVSPGGCLAWVPSVDSIYCMPAYGRYFFAYSPASTHWYSSRYLESDEVVGPGGALTSFHTSSNEFLAALFGDQGGMYSDEAGEKTILATPEEFDHFDDTPLDQDMGAAIASGDDYYYYAFFGGGADEFYRAYYQPLFGDGGQSSDGGAEQTQPVLVSPNPLSSRSAITFSLPEHGPCRLTVWDPAGRLVASLSRPLAAGRQALAWREVVPPSRKLPAGIYLLRLEAQGLTTGTRVVVN